MDHCLTLLRLKRELWKWHIDHLRVREDTPEELKLEQPQEEDILDLTPPQQEVEVDIPPLNEPPENASMTTNTEE